MDPFPSASHSRHETTPMTAHHSEVREWSARMKDNLPVPEAILQDLSLLINDEWLDVGMYLDIPDENLPKIQTDYGARQKEATYKMMLGWKQKMGIQATYSILVEALKKAGRGDLAELSIELTAKIEHIGLLQGEKSIRVLKLHEIEKGQQVFSEPHQLKYQKVQTESPWLLNKRKELQLSSDSEAKIEHIGLLQEETSIRVLKVHGITESTNLKPHRLKYQKKRTSEPFIKDQEQVLWSFQDKVGHFIRCLKVKYTSWLWSMKGTPWMKSGKFKVEDLFVDVGLQLLNPSQKISGSSWQTLHSFKALFTHPDLRRSRMINIEGESGCGKTVLLFQMAHSWCKGETFTENVKVFILLPCGLYTDDSIYKTIKTFLLPRNTFLTVDDVRNILTIEKSILALDGGSPDVINEILCNYLDPVCQSIVRNDKLQLICSSSEPLHKSKFEGIVSYMSIKLEKWHKTQRLSYLQRLLPNDDSKHDIILRWTEGNTALNVVCDNPLCYALTAYFLKDDILWGKDVKIETLSQIFRHVVECLTKTIATKSGTVDDLEAISEISYDGLLSLEKISWEIDDLKGVKHYQMLVNVGILVENQDDSLLKVAVRFRHKMFQMWFAALHLSNSTNISELYENHGKYTFSHIPNSDTSILLRFICGLNPQSSVIVLNHLARGELEDNENNDNFFLCLHEHCGTDTSLQAAVKAICLRMRGFKLACSNQLLLRSMVRFLDLASQWKIPIESIDLRHHEIIHVTADGLTLSDSIHLRPLTAKIIKINKWCGSHLAKFLSKCENLIEVRIFATEYPGHPHEIQKDVDGATYKVCWDGPDRICHQLEDGEWKIAENLSKDKIGFFQLNQDFRMTLKRILRGQHTKKIDQEDESNFLISKKIHVDAKGASIVIEEAAVSLHIPSGALTEGTDISLTVMKDAAMKLQMKEDLPIITPIVKCEPCRLKFQKPVILVLPHCGIVDDVNEKKMVCFQGDCSGKTLTWETIEGEGLSMSETECFVPISHFSLFFCTRKQLKAKRMRAITFMRIKQGRQDVIVKLWLCNDSNSSFNEIEKKEGDTGYKQVGSWQQFTIYKTLGSVEVTLRECARQEIDFNNIWRGSRGSAYFSVPVKSISCIDETIYVKQIGNDDTSRIAFDVVVRVHSDGSRGQQHLSWTETSLHNPLNSSTNPSSLQVDTYRPDNEPVERSKGQVCQPLQKRQKLQHSHSEGTSNEPSIRVNAIAGSSMSSAETVNRHQSNNHGQEVCEDIVTEKSLRNLAGLVPAEWKELGTALGLSEAQLHHIKSDNKENTNEMIYQMLLRWKKTNGLQATYGSLFQKLRKVGRKDLVEIPEEVRKWVNTQETENSR